MQHGDREPIDLDSAGVYYLSVEEFESRAGEDAGASQPFTARLAAWWARWKAAFAS